MSCLYIDFEIDPTLTKDKLMQLVGGIIYAKWEMFATHLQVERERREGIYAQCHGIVTDCFVAVTSIWLSCESGTGNLPRTWDTVFDALKLTGYPDLVDHVQEELASKYHLSRICSVPDHQALNDR